MRQNCAKHSQWHGEVEWDFNRKHQDLRKLHLLLSFQTAKRERQTWSKKKVSGQTWGVGKEMKVKQGQYDSEGKKGGKCKEPAAITKCYIKKS